MITNLGSTTTCYNVSRETYDEDNTRDVGILESEGSCDIIAPKVLGDRFKKPLKLEKVNIRTIEDPNFASIGD